MMSTWCMQSLNDTATGRGNGQGRSEPPPNLFEAGHSAAGLGWGTSSGAGGDLSKATYSAGSACGAGMSGGTFEDESLRTMLERLR